MMDLRDFSPTHRRMLELLSDGEPHSKEELGACLYDELTDADQQVKVQIFRLRKRLPASEDIRCRRHNGSTTYQHVRIMANPYRG